MNEPFWVGRAVIEAIHDEQLSAHGGAPGVRDEELLDSALGRPRNRWLYGETDLALVAAAYAFGIARNHPFVDGNKRTAFLAAYTFLGLNGLDFDATDEEIVVMTLALAGGEADEDGYAAWIRDRLPSAAPGAD